MNIGKFSDVKTTDGGYEEMWRKMTWSDEYLTLTLGGGLLAVREAFHREEGHQDIVRGHLHPLVKHLSPDGRGLFQDHMDCLLSKKVNDPWEESLLIC